MPVASHLAVSPAAYDARIRPLIPLSLGRRARGRRVDESGADEDVHGPLAEETRLLQRAGFVVDVPWRRSPFAVIVGCRQA
jgi:hypothetical protein